MQNQFSYSIATFANGCFWCTEAVFKRLKGVEEVVSGYTGGSTKNPTYNQVSMGTTGHAEALQISFDPTIISYQKLLDIFWATHNPTTLNQQGADHGTQYRSVVFYHDEEQKRLAENSIQVLTEEKKFDRPIVTEIIPATAFYRAELRHQNYYDNQPYYPYCTVVIDPKIKKLLKEFSEDIKEEYKEE